MPSMPLRYPIFLCFLLFLLRARVESLRGGRSPQALPEMGSWVAKPLTGPDRRWRSLKRDAGASCNFHRCGADRFHAFQTSSAHLIPSYDALTSGREILEPALVLASAADCLSADLSGEGFDMIWVPAEASSRKLRHRVVVGSFSAN